MSEQIDKIAEELTEYFFTNGAGQKATRLILSLGNDIHVGGWGKAPFKDHIKTVLRGRV